MKPAFGSRLAGTEALRGLACLLIVYYHVYLYTGPSGPPTRGTLYTAFISRWQLGLSFFFVLSAFLLYRPFVQAIVEQRPRPAFGAYLRNRVLRIVPAYWAILVLAAIFGVTVVWIPEHDFAFHLPTFAANMFFVSGLYPDGMQTGIPPAWTLNVEWGFYLSLPLLVLLAGALARRATTHRGRLAATLAPAAVLMAIGIAGQYAGYKTVLARDPYGFQDSWHAVIERSFPSWASLFAVGMVISVLRVELEGGRLRLPRGWRSAALAVLVAGGAGLAYLHQTRRLDFHAYNVLMGVPLGALLCAVVLSTAEPAPRRAAARAGVAPARLRRQRHAVGLPPALPDHRLPRGQGHLPGRLGRDGVQRAGGQRDPLPARST